MAESSGSSGGRDGDVDEWPRASEVGVTGAQIDDQSTAKVPSGTGAVFPSSHGGDGGHA